MQPEPVADLPDEAFAAGLLSLPELGPRRYRRLTECWTPGVAWERVRAGHPDVARRLDRPSLAPALARAAAAIDVVELWNRILGSGVGACMADGLGYPEPLLADPDHPQVCFWIGDPDAIGPARVAVVGTRRCTRYGHDLATALGRHLAERGVTVVSGLARGIDAAAHRGALAVAGAAPVAVVGTGVDVIYPRENAALWHEVARRGLVLAEVPPGTPAQRWRFPARNRIIAALAQVVVVVESHRTGGSLSTAEAAGRRGQPVFAFPGPITSAASQGTNQLLSDGAQVATDFDAVMAAVGAVAGAGTSLSSDTEDVVIVTPDERDLLDVFCWQPLGADTVVERVGGDTSAALVAIERLIERGLVARRGPWLERCWASRRALAP